MKNWIQVCVFGILMTFANVQLKAGAVPAKQTITLEQTTNKKQLRKQLKIARKQWRKQKPNQEMDGGNPLVTTVSIIMGVGMLLFIIGLIVKLKFLWILGICLFSLPIVAALVLGIIFLVSVAIGGFSMC